MIDKIVLFCIIVVLILLVLYCYHKQNEHIRSNDYCQIIQTGIPGPCIGIMAGIHGNEPAGSIEIQHMLQSGYFDSLKKGSVRIIPRANPLGLMVSSRYNGFTDMNRIFEQPLSADAKRISDFLKPCDIIVDFHEGWGYHLITPESMGSTITGNTTIAEVIAKQIVFDLNNSQLQQTITNKNPGKQFSILPQSTACEIPSTLSCLAQKRNQNHIIVETTGQNDIQPMYIRRAQTRIILDSLLKHYDLI